jgi:WD40 repeat protein
LSACAKTGHSDGLETASLSADGHTLLTVAFDRSARIWDLRSGKCLAVLAPKGQVRCCRASDSPDATSPISACTFCMLQ